MSEQTDARDADTEGGRSGAQNKGRRSTDGEVLACPICARDNPADARYCAGCGHRFGGTFPEEEEEQGADPLLGQVVAERYRIEELIGRGGMGVVYRVEHVRINKLMAMKLLHGALAREREVVKRFKREAEAVSQLDHPNTVQVFDFGQSDGMMYLVMEYLPGRDLGQIIKEDGPVPFARAARMAAQVCASVHEAHGLGIVHRDLKPENVMVLKDREVSDFVKVLDFGLAKLRDHGDADKSITRQGSILGTPYYMAPEHIRGENVDARSDVYAMGALIYKAITGVPPFWATTPVGVLTMHLTEDVEPPSQRAPKRDIPPEADRIILRALQRGADDRYQGMDELRDDLLRYLASVGQESGLDDSKRLADAGGRAFPTQSGRQRELATRGDVDDFEKQIRRRSLMVNVFAVLVLLGALFGSWWAWTHREVEVAAVESEPNNELVQANVLPVAQEYTAYLGQRLDEERSDADIYLLRNPGGARRVVRIDVSAIRNMDVTFELYREGITAAPVLTADSGSLGLPESVPNFVIDGPTYYLRVRELWESGRLPTENVSDAYTVSWRFVEPEDGDESEVNDSLELADPLEVGGAARGFIGWGGDEDVYCVASEAQGLVARLDAVATLDLVLERVDRVTGRVTRYDANGVGEGEVSDVIERAEAGAVCFEVSAHRPKEGMGNDANERYSIRLERPAPAPEPSEPE